MSYFFLWALLGTALSHGAAPEETVVRKEDFSVSAPKGWTRDDQWFRELPRLDFHGPGGEEGPRLSLERYGLENPFKLTPRKFIAALMESAPPAEKIFRKSRTRSFETYVTKKTSPAGRASDFTEHVEWLGPGSPGVRSKIERCEKWGLYRLSQGYAKARGAPKDLDSFKKLFLKGKRTRRQIEICLGRPVLAAMRRGDPVEPVLRPDEDEILRREKLERGGGGREEIQAAAVVEADNRFYVLRYTAPAGDYERGLPAFDRFLSTFKPE